MSAQLKGSVRLTRTKQSLYDSLYTFNKTIKEKTRPLLKMPPNSLLPVKPQKDGKGVNLMSLKARPSPRREPLTQINTIEAYCNWMAGIGKVTAPGATYDLHTSSYDEATKTAVFFGTYHARHTGKGGPVPPTNKETHTHYVYGTDDG